MYYNDSDALLGALEYSWRDYHIFDIKIPQWVCDLLDDARRVELELLDYKFNDKRHLLPCCFDECKM